MGKIIGIDLGTSNSTSAVMIGCVPNIIAFDNTTIIEQLFLSIVAFTQGGQLLTGQAARSQLISNPEGTILAAKLKVGTDFKFNIFGKEYAPHQILPFILQKIKNDAEAFLGEIVDKAVITVASYFNYNQIQTIKEAAKIAGLQVSRFISKSATASLAYGLDKYFTPRSGPV